MHEIGSVGFVGVGVMGHGLAKNIARAGFPLRFLDHPGNRPVDDLYALGARSTGDLAALAAGSDVVVMCVTGSPEVEQIVTGDAGLLGGLKRGAVIVDCSTVEPHVSRRVAARAAEHGAHYVDAPLTRTPKEAELGRANVMVGAEPGLLERVRPLLDAFAENVYHAGPTGAGATLKLLHNFISLGNCVLLAEAVVTAVKSGVDIDTFIEVLATGGGDSTALKRMSPFVKEGDPGGLLFSIANGAKDTGYYRSLASHLGLPATAAGAVHRVFEQAAAAGLGDRPVPELIDWMRGDG